MNKTPGLFLAALLAASGAQPASAAVAAAARAASHPIVVAPAAVGGQFGGMPLAPLNVSAPLTLSAPGITAMTFAPSANLAPAAGLAQAAAPSLIQRAASLQSVSLSGPAAASGIRAGDFAGQAAARTQSAAFGSNAASAGNSASAAPSARAAQLPAVPGASAQQPSLKDGLAQTAAAVASHARLGQTAKAGTSLNSLFDGMRILGSADFSADREAARPPDWAEDQRINRALKRLGDSRIGLDLYRHVYQNFPNLSIKVDDDANAQYDARVVREGQNVVLYLTEKLVDRESAEVVAAYIAREMSHLYFASFPESAERAYMAYGNMTRVFAELTDSGLARHRYWWNTAKDQWTGDAYAMQRYYGSWKEAVANAYHRRAAVRDSAFFRWLIQSEGKGTLRDLYRAGRIGYREYQDMTEYFNRIVESEQSWFHDTRRW